MPTTTWPMPGQESSQARRVRSAGSYDDIEHPAKPTAVRRSWPRWSSTGLLDDLVGSFQHQRRDREAERLGGLEVDDQLEFCGLLDGKIAGLGPLEDLVHVAGGDAPLYAVQVGPVAHETAGLDAGPDGE